MRTWEELSHEEQIGCLFSDAWKDVFGSRPHGHTYSVSEMESFLDRAPAMIAEDEAYWAIEDAYSAMLQAEADRLDAMQADAADIAAEIAEAALAARATRRLYCLPAHRRAL